MAEAWPTLRLVHLPIHAGWLDQIEIVLSVIAREVIAPADLADLEALAHRIPAFEPRYSATAGPFDWRSGRAGLAALPRRLAAPTPLAA